MKKVMLLTVLAALGVACASTSNTATTTTANQTLTLDEALQKSAETRQKLEQAKQTYQNAKNASAAASASNSVTDAIKTQVQNQINTSTTQVNNEVQAWKDVFAN